MVLLDPAMNKPHPVSPGGGQLIAMHTSVIRLTRIKTGVSADREHKHHWYWTVKTCTASLQIRSLSNGACWCRHIMFVPCSIHPHTKQWDYHPTIHAILCYGELLIVRMLMFMMLRNKIPSSLIQLSPQAIRSSYTIIDHKSITNHGLSLAIHQNWPLLYN